MKRHHNHFFLDEGTKMRKQWMEKNIDLALLSEHIGEFFKDRGIKTRKEESANECTILGTTQHPRVSREQVSVRILRRSNGFAIDFSVGERARSDIRLGLITTIIGGGDLVLRGLKSQEALRRLEEEFWAYVEELIAHFAR